jgi:hypothetical protein
MICFKTFDAPDDEMLEFMVREWLGSIHDLDGHQIITITHTNMGYYSDGRLGDRIIFAVFYIT